jgi:hypothetical protein
LGVTFAAAVEGQERKDKEKPAASPEEAVKSLREALRAGDARAVMNRLAEPERSTLALDLAAQPLHEKWRKALDDKFGKEANAMPQRSAMSRVLEMFLFDDQVAVESEEPPEKDGTIDIQVRAKEAKDKGRVLLTVWLSWGKESKRIAEHRWEAVQEGDDWKLLTHVFGEQSAPKVKRKTADNKEIEVLAVTPGGYQPTLKMVDYVKNVLPKSQADVDRLCKEVGDGKYASRAEALKVYGKVAQDFIKAHPLPRTEPRIKPADEK